MQRIRSATFVPFVPSTPLCFVCNGEGWVPVFTHDGEQTQYTTRCPHCAGFGRAAAKQELSEVAS